MQPNLRLPYTIAHAFKLYCREFNRRKSMKHLLCLSACLLFASLTIAQSPQCLLGNCKTDFSVLIKADTVLYHPIIVSVGVFDKPKQFQERFQGPAYHFEIRNADEARISCTQYDGYIQTANRGDISNAWTGVNTVATSRDDFKPGGSYEQDMWAAEYHGTFTDLMPNGRGTLEYDKRRLLEKIFADSPSLLKFVGGFTNGQPDGPGRLYYSNGHSDSVVFKDGVLVSPQTPDAQGFRTGCISGDCINGWGTFVWAHSKTYTYTGLFKEGKPAIFGFYQYMNGEMYLGQLSNDGQYEGRGYRAHYPAMLENGLFAGGAFVAGYNFNGMHYFDNLNFGPAVAHTPSACRWCHGKGEISTADCKRCHGTGQRSSTQYHNDEVHVKQLDKETVQVTTKESHYSTSTYDCTFCKGTGKVWIPCPYCKGTGKE